MSSYVKRKKITKETELHISSKSYSEEEEKAVSRCGAAWRGGTAHTDPGQQEARRRARERQAWTGLSARLGNFGGLSFHVSVRNCGIPVSASYRR